MTVFMRAITRMAIGLAGVAVVASACGGAQSDDEVRATLIDELTIRAGVSEDDATCIIDQALENHSLTDLADLNGDNPSTEVQDSVARTTLSCLLEGDSLDDLMDDDGEDEDEDADDNLDGSDDVDTGRNGSDDVNTSSSGDGDNDSGNDAVDQTNNSNTDNNSDTVGNNDGPVSDLGPTAETPAPTPVAIAGQQAFCDSSADYYVAFHAVDSFNESDPGQFRAGFELMQLHLDTAVNLAPTAELAEAPTVAKEHFDVVHAELRSFAYEWNDFESSGRYDALEDRLGVLNQIDSLLAEYLLGPCQQDGDTLDRRIESLAEDLASPQTTDQEPATSSIPDGYTAVYDPTDRLRVIVPEDWAYETSSTTATSSVLIVAPDTEAYETSWMADGLQMTVTDAGPAFDWRQPMYSTAAAKECSLVDSRPYDDGLYNGWIDTYEACGSTTDAIVIGATNEDRSIEILVEVQFDAERTAQDGQTLEVITDSFMAR